MAQAKTGERYSVTISIAKPGTGDKTDYAAYNDAAVAEFTMVFALNKFPKGKARLIGQSADVMAPASGTYGMVAFSSVEKTGDSRVYPMYVIKASRELVSSNACAIDIEFEVGNKGTQAVMDSMAVECSSIDAMKKLCTAAGIESVSYVDTKAASDNMVWRFVEGTLPQHLLTVITHCVIPGDIAYWAFDEGTNKVVIGSFGTSKTSSTKRLLMYSQDANQGTTFAAKKVNGSDTKVWFYNGYLPEDLSGEMRSARSPNLCIDSVGPNGEKEVGDCAADCWGAILEAMGANPVYLEDAAYSKQVVVKTFPKNTHKMYAIAPYVRRYMNAEYAKRVTLNLYNNPGPKIGSCVHFYAESPVKRDGDFLPDPEYTARYIVIGKTIRKVSTTSVGLLGRTVDTTSSDMVTEMSLASNAGYAGIVGKEYQEVVKLAEAVVNNVGKDGKK